MSDIFTPNNESPNDSGSTPLANHRHNMGRDAEKIGAKKGFRKFLPTFPKKKKNSHMLADRNMHNNGNNKSKQLLDVFSKKEYNIPGDIDGVDDDILQENPLDATINNQDISRLKTKAEPLQHGQNTKPNSISKFFHKTNNIIKYIVVFGAIITSAVIGAVLIMLFTTLIPAFDVERDYISVEQNIPAEARDLRPKVVTPIAQDVTPEQVKELPPPYKDYFSYENNFPLMPIDSFISATSDSANLHDVEPLKLLDDYTAIWKDNLVRYPAIEPDKYIVSIIINDVGAHLNNSLAILDLPKPVGMAILPGLKKDYNKALLTKMNSTTHEVLMHVPLEADSDNVQAGVYPLLLSDDARTLRRKMQWNIDGFPSFVGVTHHQGTTFSEHDDKMTDFLTMVKATGAYYIDTVTSAKSLGFSTANRLGVSSLYRDITLDAEQDGRKIRSQIRIAERIARQKGYVMMMAHPFPETFQVLSYWMRQANARGFQIVPPSILLDYIEKANDR